MLRLAVATAAETLERLRAPLAERGIEVVHLDVEGRLLPLDGPPADFAGIDVGFVYPSRLMEGGVADVLLGVPWVNDREAVLRSRNKAGVLARLAEAGLPTPTSVMISSPADEATLRAAFERVGPPVVVKPNSATRGVGVARADDLDSFLGLCEYLGLVHDFRATGDKSYLVQAFVPDAVDYRGMVVDGSYAGAVERRLPGTERAAGRWKHNVHRDAHAEGVDLPGELRELVEETARVLDVPFLGVDLLVAERGEGRIVVSETAARPTVDAAEKYEPDFHDRLASLIEATSARGRET